MTAKRIFQTLALLLFLVGLPFGSWYYLKTGIDYRKELIADLGDYATLDTVVLKAQLGPDFRVGELWRKTGVWVFLPKNEELQDSYRHYLRELYGQFSEKGEDLTFYLLPAEAGEDPASFTSEMEVAGDLFTFWQPDDPEALALGEFELPLAGGQLAENPYLALTDSITVSKYYDVRESGDMARLVEHIVLLFPQEEEITELKREVEK